MSDQQLRLSERPKVKAEYTDTKAKHRSIKVRRPGSCALCPATYALTKHHIFGSGQNLTVVLCRNCHHMMHAEIEGGMVGAFGRRRRA